MRICIKIETEALIFDLLRIIAVYTLLQSATKEGAKEMKRSILVWLMVGFVYGCAGLQPITEQERTFDAVFDAPGFKKDQIFNATKIWVAENFRSAKSVLEYESKEDGILIGNGVIPYPCKGFDCMSTQEKTTSFTMRIDMKDDKFKLAFSNIRIITSPSYSSALGVQSGSNEPMGFRGELDVIKPKLLTFGNEIIASFRKGSDSKNW